MTEVKVLMVGPMNSGKSALTNFIADAVQNSENPKSAPTQPTKGVRIVEFDRKIPTKKGEVSESRERQRGARAGCASAALPARMHVCACTLAPKGGRGRERVTQSGASQHVCVWQSKRAHHAHRSKVGKGWGEVEREGRRKRAGRGRAGRGKFAAAARKQGRVGGREG